MWNDCQPLVLFCFVGLRLYSTRHYALTRHCTLHLILIIREDLLQVQYKPGQADEQDDQDEYDMICLPAVHKYAGLISYDI